MRIKFEIVGFVVNHVKITYVLVQSPYRYRTVGRRPPRHRNMYDTSSTGPYPKQKHVERHRCRSPSQATLTAVEGRAGSFTVQ